MPGIEQNSQRWNKCRRHTHTCYDILWLSLSPTDLPDAEKEPADLAPDDHGVRLRLPPSDFTPPQVLIISMMFLEQRYFF